MNRQFDKFSYPDIRQDTYENKRLYSTPEGDRVPSVTTILSKTKDMSGLKKWEARVGKKQAQKIRNEAATVGTSMHLFLEHYLVDTKRPFFTPSTIHTQAKQMADIVVTEGLKHVSELWGSEVKLYYKDEYAGTTDGVGIYKNKPCVIDFKQTNKPKKSEWIEDYYLQLCAYIHAHNEMFGTDIETGVVLMCSRDLQFQKFELNEIQFEKYSYMWWNRLHDYHALPAL